MLFSYVTVAYLCIMFPWSWLQLDKWQSTVLCVCVQTTHKPLRTCCTISTSILCSYSIIFNLYFLIYLCKWQCYIIYIIFLTACVGGWGKCVGKSFLILSSVWMEITQYISTKTFTCCITDLTNLIHTSTNIIWICFLMVWSFTELRLRFLNIRISQFVWFWKS